MVEFWLARDYLCVVPLPGMSDRPAWSRASRAPTASPDRKSRSLRQRKRSVIHLSKFPPDRTSAKPTLPLPSRRITLYAEISQYQRAQLARQEGSIRESTWIGTAAGTWSVRVWSASKAAELPGRPAAGPCAMMRKWRHGQADLRAPGSSGPVRHVSPSPNSVDSRSPSDPNSNPGP